MCHAGAPDSARAQASWTSWSRRCRRRGRTGVVLSPVSCCTHRRRAPLITPLATAPVRVRSRSGHEVELRARAALRLYACVVGDSAASLGLSRWRSFDVCVLRNRARVGDGPHVHSTGSMAWRRRYALRVPRLPACAQVLWREVGPRLQSCTVVLCTAAFEPRTLGHQTALHTLETLAHSACAAAFPCC